MLFFKKILKLKKKKKKETSTGQYTNKIFSNLICMNKLLASESNLIW